MFSKLKEKLRSWTRKVSEKADETPEEKTKEVKTPLKFNAGVGKYEPDLEKLQEQADKIKKEIERLKTKKKPNKEIKKIQPPTKEELQKKADEIKKEIEELKKKRIKSNKEITKEELQEQDDKIEKEIKELENLKKAQSTKKELQISTPKIPREPASSQTLGLGGREEKSEEPTDPKKPGFFSKVSSRITKVKITEKDFEVYGEELEMLLLENNVALEVADKIIKDLKSKIVGKELLKKEIEEEIKDIFKEIIKEILIDPFYLDEKIKEKTDKPYVILFCGINGTGKTTTIAKIAEQLKSKKISCVLAAADTFRAASIEQIKEHGERVGVKVIAHEYGSDPAAVGFDAIKYAQKNKIDCVLIDTAGRMHTAKNLLKEIEKISKVCKPDTKIFVGESITGNDAIEQVKSFDWSIGIDGIILTKADIDEKGGTALSVGYVTKKPILYLGTGQEMDDIIPFNKEDFIKKLGLE